MSAAAAVPVVPALCLLFVQLPRARRRPPPISVALLALGALLVGVHFQLVLEGVTHACDGDARDDKVAERAVARRGALRSLRLAR